MTMNLDADPSIVHLDMSSWTPFDAEVAVNIANAKLAAFEDEAWRLAEFVRRGFLTRASAADTLHQAAVYNDLLLEYGADRIQRIVSAAFQEAAA